MKKKEKVEKIVVDSKDSESLFFNSKSLKKFRGEVKWDDDKLFPLKKARCVQCGQEMDAILELEKWTIPVCINSSCPNFGLLQIGVEKVCEFIDKQK